MAPTLQAVRACFAKKRIPDIIEIGPLTGFAYIPVVEVGTPQHVIDTFHRNFEEYRGTQYTNLMLVVDDTSMCLRYEWNIPD